jgi:hypothetical protein
MSLRGTVWKPIGPSPIAEGGLRANGVATAIATHPNNANIVYLGTAGGGVWRTMDAGGTWTPLFDVQLALGIGEPGALAIDPNNTTSYMPEPARGRCWVSEALETLESARR